MGYSGVLYSIVILWVLGIHSLHSRGLAWRQFPGFTQGRKAGIFAGRDFKLREIRALNWYVAQFFYGRELAAAKQVDSSSQGGLRAFCPLERVSWVNRGAKVERLIPVLAGYVFVEMEPGDPYRWHDVAQCDGFFGFIGGSDPTPAMSSSSRDRHDSPVGGLGVEDLLARCAFEPSNSPPGSVDWVLIDEPVTTTRHHGFTRGSAVKITVGNLENCVGRVEWVREREDGPAAQVTTRAFFDLEIRVELPVRWLERVGKQQEQKARTLVDLPIVR